MPHAPAIKLESAPAVFTAAGAAPAGPIDGQEQRRAPRHRFDPPAQLVPWPASSRTAPIDVWLIDYSATGVGLLHTEALRVGQKFILRQSMVTDESASCVFTVVRCDPRDDGQYNVGLHVSETAAEQETFATSKD